MEDYRGKILDVRDHKIYIAKEAGFCFGVRRAVEELEKILQKYQNKKIFVTGEIIHNRDVINYFKEKGVIFLEKEEDIPNIPSDSVVVIRAHGLQKKYRQILLQRNDITLVDLTCPFVYRLHKLAREFQEKEFFIVIVGDREHPETKGIYEEVKESAYIMEPEMDEKELFELINIGGYNKIALMAQTTMSIEQFVTVSERILSKFFPKVFEVTVLNTICPATLERQESAREIAQKVDYCIVLGGKHSANTRRLYQICSKYTNAVHIERINEIDVSSIVKSYKTIGITAGASTPDNLIVETVEVIKNTIENL